MSLITFQFMINKKSDCFDTVRKHVIGNTPIPMKWQFTEEFVLANIVKSSLTGVTSVTKHN